MEPIVIGDLVINLANVTYVDATGDAVKVHLISGRALELDRDEGEELLSAMRELASSWQSDDFWEPTDEF